MSQEVTNVCIDMMIEKFHTYKPFELCGEVVHVTEMLVQNEYYYTLVIFKLSNGSVLKLKRRCIIESCTTSQC